MASIGDIRRANLELVVGLPKIGTLDGLAELAGTSSVYLSQIRNQTVDVKTGRPREMGTRIARRIEDAAGLPTGWMDREHAEEGAGRSAVLDFGRTAADDSRPWPLAPDLYDRLMALNERWRGYVEGKLDDVIGDAEMRSGKEQQA